MDDLQCRFFSQSSLTLRLKSHLLIAEHAQTLARLENADLQIEDLKSQLDDALESEEMLVQLTERNLFMGEVRHSIYHFH